MEAIIVGSRAFFSGMEGYRAQGCDTLTLTTEPDGFDWRRESCLRGNRQFTYLLESPAAMVQRTLDAAEPLLVGKFLVPEVAEAIGATVDDILPLEPLLEKLDDKHRYVAVIYEAVKTNGSFTLSDEQRLAAFEAYRSARERKPQRTVREHVAEAEAPSDGQPAPDSPDAQQPDLAGGSDSDTDGGTSA